MSRGAVLFDWDGTLTDGIEGVWIIQDFLFKNYIHKPYPITPSQLRDQMGKGLYVDTYVDYTIYRQLHDQHLEQLDQYQLTHLPSIWFDVPEAMNRLRQAGFSLVLVSGAQPKQLKTELDHSGLTFDMVTWANIPVGQQIDPLGKAPRIKTILNQHPEWKEVYYLGDTPKDANACYEADPQKNRILPILIARSFTPRSQLEAVATTVLSISDATDLIITGHLFK